MLQLLIPDRRVTLHIWLHFPLTSQDPVKKNSSESGVASNFSISLIPKSSKLPSSLNLLISQWPGMAQAYSRSYWGVGCWEEGIITGSKIWRPVWVTQQDSTSKREKWAGKMARRFDPWEPLKAEENRLLDAVLWPSHPPPKHAHTQINTCKRIFFLRELKWWQRLTLKEKKIFFLVHYLKFIM